MSSVLLLPELVKAVPVASRAAFFIQVVWFLNKSSRFLNATAQNLYDKWAYVKSPPRENYFCFLRPANSNPSYMNLEKTKNKSKTHR